MSRKLSLASLVGMVLLLAGCAGSQGNVDYSAFRESKPASILVLPPLNETLEPRAGASVLAQVTQPLAESGYYVVPVGVMMETLRANGLYTEGDAHEAAPTKLREVFGADAVLYMTVTEYGANYRVIASDVKVSLEASLVDLRTGAKLWEGQQTAMQTSGDAGMGLIGKLASALVSQVVNDMSDKAYDIAGLANQGLLSAGRPDGLLYGPRSAHYEL